ncbi:MAG: DUF503 domain-containing protein [Deltaproteobacteria bacterium]|nr:DUF503 domain-containing protein [Deltaproteobacteria bacterium]MDP3029011.1 DUF503 domain-containing protein [Deltaproteobacteria bacterium]
MISERQRHTGMVIGICWLDLHLPENGSLKGKRKVIKSIIARVRDKFNVSIGEVDGHDLWQKAQLGIAAVGNDRRVVNSALDKIAGFIESMCLAEVLEIKIEIISL